MMLLVYEMMTYSMQGSAHAGPTAGQVAGVSCTCSLTARQELQESMDEPGRFLAHSGRLAAKCSRSGCSS